MQLLTIILNLIGLSFQIIGVLILYKAVRIASYGDSTIPIGPSAGSEDTSPVPYDKKTMKRISIFQIPNPEKAKYGVIMIIIGLSIQIIALLISSFAYFS